MALPKGWSADRLAIWELHIKGHKMPGRFVIIDGEIVPWEDD